MVRHLLDLRVVLRRHSQHNRTARLDFLHIAHHLVKQILMSGQRDHQGSILHKGDGAMFELPCGIGVRMDVGDFLELQGALQGHCIV